MKILFLTNNIEVTSSLVNWLRGQGEEVVVLDGKIDLSLFKKNNPDFIISYNYGYLIDKSIIRKMKNKIINLHISLLPYNRGADPNFWSFYEDTPRGVTIHKIDEGIDTGEILLQKEIFFNENKETLKSSYEKLHNEIQNLFINNWSKFKKSYIKGKKQEEKEGTYHKSEEFKKIKKNLGSDIFNIPIIKLKNNIKD